MRTRIERMELEGRNGSEVGRFIDTWHHLEEEGWAVTVLAESVMRRGFRHTVALVALACTSADGALPEVVLADHLVTERR